MSVLLFYFFQGNDIRLLHFDRTPNSNGNDFSVSIMEDQWVRADGQVVGREHLLMALADVDYILVLASEDSSATSKTGLGQSGTPGCPFS